MKHSTLARLIAGNNRSAERRNDDKHSAHQKPDTPDDDASGTEAALPHDAERMTTTNDDGPHAANGDA